MSEKELDPQRLEGIGAVWTDTPKRSASVEQPKLESTSILWWWNTKWMRVEERGFVEIALSSFQIDRVLLAVGLVESRGAAQRLIKQKGVSIRCDDGNSDWAQVTDAKQEINAGWPVVLRVGNGHWRTVQVEELGTNGKPISRPKAIPSLALVMRSTEEQTIDLWTEMWL